MTLRHSRAPFGVMAALAALSAVAVTGCAASQPLQDSLTPVAGQPSATLEEAEVIFDPILIADQTATKTVEIAAANGTISFDIPYPLTEVTGVDEDVAEAFSAAVVAQADSVADRAAGFAGITVDGCDGSCSREAELTLEHAGLYEQYGAVASTTTWMFGARDRNAVVSSVTMDLETGQEAKLADFLDSADEEAVARAEATVRNAANGASCDAADYLTKVAGFAPTNDGLLLLWEVDQTQTAQCGVEHALVPWGGSIEEAAAPADLTTPDGTWCPTAESFDADCMTIQGDTKIFAGGQVETITASPAGADGTISLNGIGAPVGTFIPAGTPAVIPDYYPGVDLPDQARIFNGQTATMYLRQ